MKKEPLVELIHSMTQSEKRYFKLHASFMFAGESKNYLKLYDLISKQQKYEEEKIKKEFNKTFFAQQKRQLFLKLLESLRSFHKDISINAQIETQLNDFRIFIEKSMLTSAKKAIKKAEDLAIRFEKFPELILIKKAETELFVAKNSPKELSQHLEKLKLDLPFLVQNIENELKIEKEYLLFIKINQETEFLRSYIEKSERIGSNTLQLFKNKKEAVSIISKIQINYMKGMYHFIVGEFEDSYLNFSRQYELYKQHQMPAKEFELESAKALANMILLCLLQKNRKNYELLKNNFIQIKTQNTTLIDSLKYWNYLFELKYFCMQNRFNDALMFMLKKETEITLLTDKLATSNLLNTERVYVIFDTCWIYISLQKFKDANKVLQHFFVGEGIKKDIFVFASFLSIFVDIEMNKFSLAESKIISLKKLIKENNRLFEFEKITLKFLDKLILHTGEFNSKKEWNDFAQQLEILKKLQFEKNAFVCFDFLKYSQSKYKY